MSVPQALMAARPQLIPTNAGERTFASPPEILQRHIIPNELFYIRNHWKEPPKLDLATYRLEVGGEVGRQVSLSLQDIQEMPHRRLQVTLECCGNSPVPEYWAKQTRSIMEKVSGHGIMGNAEWMGVPLSMVLERAGLKSMAKEVVFTGADHGPDEVVGDPPEVAYERSLPVEKAMHADTLLAFAMNGEALPPQHGFPLRLIVPGWYGMTSVKWLVGIRAVDHPFEGFYQKERYMVMNGPEAETFYTYLTQIRVKSIITNPTPGEIVPCGTYRVAGAAWSGEKEVVRVEVSTDGGKSWSEARVLPRVDYSWYRWEFLWEPTGAGQYILMSRATNSKGETQPMEFPNKWDGRSYGNNMVFPHPAEVRALSGRP